MAVDWTDPCARAVALRSKYYELLAGGGGQIASIRFADREVTYATGSAGLSELREEMLAAEQECEAAATGRPQRHAMRLGSYRK